MSIYVPRRDPCACADCVKKANGKADKRNSDNDYEDGDSDDDDIDPLEILRTEQWTPKSARGQRTIFFGWSPRITAALYYYYFEVLEQPGITITQQANRDRMKKTSGNRDVLPEMTVQPLRATAASFFASLGASKQHLLNIMGWVNEDMRSRYVRAFGLQTSVALAQLVGREDLADDIVPEDPGPRFPIALGTRTFAREPFDVQEHYLMALKKETDYQQHLTVTHRSPKDSIRHLYNPAADEQTTHLHASINRLEELELRFAHDAEDGSEEKAYLREYLTESETPLNRDRLTNRLGADDENESPAEEQTAFDKEWLDIDLDVDDNRGTAEPGWPVGPAWTIALERAAESRRSFIANSLSARAMACLGLGSVTTGLLVITAMSVLAIHQRQTFQIPRLSQRLEADSL